MTLSNNVKKRRQTQKRTHHVTPFTEVQKEAQLAYDVRTQDRGYACRGQRRGRKRPRGRLREFREIHVCYLITVLFTRVLTLREFTELHS